MKKIILLSITVLVLSCTQTNKKPSFTILGTIKGMTSGQALLKYSTQIDTSIVKNGKFVFIGTIDQPIMCQLSIMGIDSKKEFYLENSTISIKGDIDSLDKAIIAGSRLENEKISYDIMLSKYDKKFAEIENEFETADKTKKEHLLKLYDKLDMDQMRSKRQFIKDNPTSFLCISILNDIKWSFNSSSEFNEYIKILESTFSKNNKLLQLKELAERMGKVDVGKSAIDFEMEDINGNKIKLSNLYSKSNYLLLDFWASTCGPCRKDNANIRVVYSMFHDKGFDILSFSTDTKKEAWLKAVEVDSLIWNNVCSLKKWEENEIVNSYALRQVSNNFLINQSGTILARDLRGDDLMNELIKLY